LRDYRRHRREHHPDARDPQPEGRRAHRPLPGQPDGDERRQAAVRDGRREQGGRQRCPATDRARRDQFLSAALLLVPGVADDDEEAHDGGEEAGVDADAPGGQGAEGVVEDGADQGTQ
jgi:hypothetical protein